MADLAKSLLKARKEKKCTQKQVAQEIGISERNYQDYEYGKVEPVASKLIALADYFGVSLDYLVGRSDNPEVNR